MRCQLRIEPWALVTALCAANEGARYSVLGHINKEPDDGLSAKLGGLERR